jgi:hypothetical protein
MEWRDVEHRILLPYPHGLVTYDEYTLSRKWREQQSKLSYCWKKSEKRIKLLRS